MANNFPTIIPSLNMQFANTGVLPPDVTFTRASSSGGYYDGVTVSKAEENLLTFSEQFDNAIWTKNDASVTANATTAPNGTATADKLIEAATTAIHTVRQTITTIAATHIYSVYLKAAERSFALLRYGNSDGITVNLTTGVSSLDVGSVSSITSTDAGSGWWRVSFAVTTVAAGGSFRIYVSTDGVGANASYAGDGTSGIFVWGAQVEQRASVTAYNVTTTQAITNYIPKLLFAPVNVPVFDHNPTTGEALGLSVWEARTNLLQRSQEFDNAYWTKIGSSISANQIIAPDGTLTADKLIEDTATSGHSVQGTSVSVTSGVVYTFSIIAKAAERSFIRINGNSSGLVGATYYNLSTGALGTVAAGTTASIVALGNGVYRCIFTRTSTGTANVSFLVSVTNADNTSSYTGDGYSGIYIWGAQFEAGAFATPYIPTVASTVARSADVAVMTGANFSRWFNAGEGSFVANALTANTAATGGILSAEDGTANNRMQLRNNSSGAMSLTSVITGTAEVSLTNGSFAANVYKTGSFVYKFNDYAASCDGAAVTTDTVARVPLVNQLVIGGGISQSSMNGYIKSISYYPARLTNAQLQAVTA